MGLYRVCPNCGNTEENVGIYVCADCHLIFCDRCGNKDFDQFPLPFTTMHCPRCNSKEVNSNGLICNNDKGVSQIIRDDESVTVITDQGSCVTCDQRSYWLESENQRRFDEAVEEALHRDSQKSALPKGISQIIRDEESVTVITEQGSCVTCDQRSYWLESENQRRFDEAVEAALNRDNQKCTLPKGISQIIRDEESVTVITDQGSCVTCDQRSYWLESENQRRFDEAVEAALNRDNQKCTLPKGISQIIRDEESVTVITDQGSCVTCDQRSYWLESENQRRFDEAVEEALRRDSQKGKSSKDCSQTIISGNSGVSIEMQSNRNNRNKDEDVRGTIERNVNSYSTSRGSTSQLLDEAMSRLQQKTQNLKEYSYKNTTGKCKACGSTWPLSILERGNGLCPMCQRMQERQR